MISKIKDSRTIILFLAALFSNTIFAESDAELVAEEESKCRTFEAHESKQAGIERWESCWSIEGERYSLKGINLAEETIASIEYSATQSRATLQGRLNGHLSAFSAEFHPKHLLIDSTFIEKGDFENNSEFEVAQLSLRNDYCGSSEEKLSIEGEVWTPHTASDEVHGELALLNFYDKDTSKKAATLIHSVLELASTSSIFTYDALPIGLNAALKLETLSPALIGFGLAEQASLSSPSKGIGDCVLLALGATGAIIGAMNDNPTLGVTCSSSCGGALVCLGTVLGGGSASVPCGLAVGSCLGCVGVGYSRNFSGCFRHFLQVE